MSDIEEAPSPSPPSDSPVGNRVADSAETSTTRAAPTPKGRRSFGGLLWLAAVLAGWLIFVYVALYTPGGLDSVWQSVRELPVVVQIVLWLVLLPYMAALWVWQADWSVPVRVGVIGGIALGTVLFSIPRKR